MSAGRSLALPDPPELLELLNSLNSLRLTILLTVFTSLFGCATTEPLPTYFILSSRGDRPRIEHASGPVRVYVRPVEVPAYLLRRNVASMHGDEIRYAPTALWALPLDQAIAVGVATNLSRAGIPAIGFQPTEVPPAHRFEVAIRITHFEGHDTGDVFLAGTWRVTTPAGETLAMRSVSLHRSGWQPGHYAELVALLSDELSELSKQIAAGLR